MPTRLSMRPRLERSHQLLEIAAGAGAEVPFVVHRKLGRAPPRRAPAPGSVSVDRLAETGLAPDLEGGNHERVVRGVRLRDGAGTSAGSSRVRSFRACAPSARDWVRVAAPSSSLRCTCAHAQSCAVRRQYRRQRCALSVIDGSGRRATVAGELAFLQYQKRDPGREPMVRRVRRAPACSARRSPRRRTRRRPGSSARNR